MNLKMNRQALFALFLIILDVGYFAQALTLPAPFQLGEPGPAFLPIVLAVVLFVSCVRILWLELAGTSSEDDGESQPAARISLRSILLIVVTGLFVWVFEPLGYWISTLLYTFVVASLFEYERTNSIRKSAMMAAIIATGVTVAGYLFFVTLFGLGLPEGII